jgi:transposase InsO family protein
MASEISDEDIVKLYQDPATGLRGLIAFARDNQIPLKRAREVLQGLESYTLNRQPRHTFQRRRTYVRIQNHQFQIDLADMSHYAEENNGVNFLLCCIDCFSKYAWVLPLKTKSASDVAAALKTIFDETTPKLVQTDNGSEFYNKTVKKLLEKYDIELFSSNSFAKASIVERFIRSFKSIISHLWIAQNSFKYIDKLPELVKSYNNRFHRSIGMAPSEVNEANAAEVNQKLYPEAEEFVEPKFNVDDMVRTSLSKGVFDKESSHQHWTTELFRIVQVLPTNPTTYKLVDFDDKKILRAYYEEQLQKVVEPIGKVYKVEKVLKYRTKKGKREALVRWLGYGEEFDSWIDASELKDIEA